MMRQVSGFGEHVTMNYRLADETCTVLASGAVTPSRPIRRPCGLESLVAQGGMR
jgi:hypothetical protein